jgi:outer membrane protein TolC
LTQSVVRARGEVKTALVAYQKGLQRLKQLDDAAAANERAAELARLRFEEGASDFLPVLDAERTLPEAQDRRAQARTATTLSLVAVYHALGGTWPGT